MATMFEKIQASQFSTLRLAIHHMAVIALDETSESNTGVLLSVMETSKKYMAIQLNKKKPRPNHSSFLVHQLMG